MLGLHEAATGRSPLSPDDTGRRTRSRSLGDPRGALEEGKVLQKSAERPKRYSTQELHVGKLEEEQAAEELIV